MARILLIEDDPSMSNLYKRVLLLEGFEVDLAENGAIGWDLVQKNTYDAILCDIMMPVMNGMEFLDKMCTSRMCQLVPVFMLTNLSASAEDRTKVMEGGAVGYIVKSEQDPLEFVQLIRDSIAKISQSEANSSPEATPQ